MFTIFNRYHKEYARQQGHLIPCIEEISSPDLFICHR